MKLRLLVPIYALTLLLSAALLFSVQPMFSKMILPLLGGTPQVWNTAMLFFQLMLLGGYAYAHGTSRFLNIRAQAILHLVLLLIFIFVLPISIPEGWLPPVNKDPTIWQLSLMTITVGGPFFVLAGSAPMLQRWFAHTNHPDADNPYFLYGASNLGSMSALLAYPFLIEPLLDLQQQSESWTTGYLALIIFTLVSAALVWNSGSKKSKNQKTANDTSVSVQKKLLWLILAFVPSSLMLGVTTHITTDIASVPLLWILPLALYVSTFVIVFARKPLVKLRHLRVLHGLALIALLFVTTSSLFLNPVLFIGLHFLIFFVISLSCHMELAQSKPSAHHLTEFYLIMSVLSETEAAH